MLAGNGVRTAGAAELVYELAHKTNIPVLTTMNGADLAQDDIHIGFIGTHGNRAANMILNECDLIISVGARLGIRQVGRVPKMFAPNAELIRCDIDEYELSRSIKEGEQKFHTDAKMFLEMLLAEDTKDYSEWRDRCFRVRDFLYPYDKQEGNRAVEAISALLPADPIVAADVGMNQCWCAQSLHLKGRKGRIHISGGYGTMGCSLPFAIGASISEGGAAVFCITGDGGLQMNIQELETVKREQLPVKILVLNNHVLGKISETQHLEHGDRFMATTSHSGYSVPDFKSIAEAYGLRAAALSSYQELHEYSEWFSDREPCLIDIALPEASRLTPKIQFDTLKTTPELESSVLDKAKEILSC